ncbi:DUF3298 domain-containing protein [Romboutsia weinsteinii]|uniref:DUF3298 domain-containing protein n=1 Tax=Romboutsia weinsteinii TaxID=2020949 RepID=A0A371J3N2_9FIRM|nr:DUF3298 and DUF4163 domain-containing protein [Romboutsia weinsteinii]RDY27390.1 DUF3298 domain-containing protein [Romboutsia weinsteinii]
MLSIEKRIIEEIDPLSKYIINYPVITNKNTPIINYLNQTIEQDIKAFKEAREHQIHYETIKPTGFHYITMTEYRTPLNQNKILSIAIEFSQLIGIYDITYIKSYNYDLNIEKEINLSDIFLKEIDYIELINNEIITQIKANQPHYEFSSEDFVGILDSQVFYLEEDGITICFSSYEMDMYCPEVFEFKILFEDYEDYLSNYTLNNLYMPC